MPLDTISFKLNITFTASHVYSFKGEAWGWACFYAGVTATAFGSAYYHMKPNDARLLWDRLPVSLAPSIILF